MGIGELLLECGSIYREWYGLGCDCWNELSEMGIIGIGFSVFRLVCGIFRVLEGWWKLEELGEVKELSC